MLTKQEKDVVGKIRKFMALEDSEYTSLSEPQWCFYLKSGRSLEITLESDGLADKERYCSIRLHCTDDEFNEQAYRSTLGVVEQGNTHDIGEGTIEEVLDEAAEIACTMLRYHSEALD